jgi:general stress protein 26
MKSRLGLLQAWPLLLLLVAPQCAYAQADNEKKPDSATLIASARELMTTVRYCALITIDAHGRAQARAMDPFPPDENLVVWLATNPTSRKVREIRRNPHVVLYYFDSASQGYVSISGIARIVNDPKEKVRHWKEEWKAFYPNRPEDYLLIAVTPEKLEVVIEQKGIVGKSRTWKAPTVRFGRRSLND